ncbi:MAG: uL4 family ribosomal protein [Candidatus Micrarchaeia archaeon]
MQAKILNLEAKEEGEIELPKIFEISPNVELIERAFLAERSYLFQPQGRFPLAGMQTTAEYIGRKGAYRSLKNRGIAKLPREKLGGGVMGNVKFIPSAVKGRRAHPPKVEKRIIERMNRKEYTLALMHAIAFTLKANSPLKQPIVVDSKIEDISKTKEVVSFLKSIGLGNFLKSKPKIRKKRRSSRVVKYKKQILIVASSKDAKIVKASSNITGVRACGVEELRVIFLAPNANPRIVVWSKKALESLEEKIKNIKLEEVRELKESGAL